MEGNRETCCSRCIHLKVCSLKERFLKVQEAVDNVKIYIPEPDGMRELRLSDIDWIKPVKLSCANFLDPTSQIIHRVDPYEGGMNLV